MPPDAGCDGVWVLCFASKRVLARSVCLDPINSIVRASLLCVMAAAPTGTPTLALMFKRQSQMSFGTPPRVIHSACDFSPPAPTAAPTIVGDIAPATEHRCVESKADPQLSAGRDGIDVGMPHVGFKWCVGGVAVSLFDVDGEQVYDIDPDDVDKVLFFKLDREPWPLRAIFPNKRFDFGRMKSSATCGKLRSALMETFGKHRRSSWHVDKSGQPMSSSHSVSVVVDDVELQVLARKWPMFVRASRESLGWLVKSFADEFCKAVNQKDAIDKPIEHHIQPYSADDLNELKNYGIKFYPSKRALVCGKHGKHTIKLKLDMRRFRNDPAKSDVYMRKRAQKAKRAAIQVVVNDAADEADDHVESDDSMSALDSHAADVVTTDDE